MLSQITIEQILSWDPCEEYDTKQKIIDATDSDWPKTPLQIAALDISINDRLWVLLRPEIIPEKQLHLLACDFAEDVLPFCKNEYPEDCEPRQAIEAKRKWVAGEISDEQLNMAIKAILATRLAMQKEAAEPVWSVAMEAAYTSRLPISTVFYAASDAVNAAARVKIQKKQLARVVEVLKCLVK